MSMLSNVGKRFEIWLQVEGSPTRFRGVIDEPPSGEPPAQRFNIPRRLLRVTLPSPAAIGQIITTPGGTAYMLAQQGLSESRDTLLFRAFRMFTVTDRLRWKQRTLVTHPVSGAKVDDAMVDRGLIPGTLEPNRETFDKGFAASWATYYFTTNQPVKADDLIGERKVVRADAVLGLTLCELQ